MKKYFKEQLKNSEPISKEMLIELRSKSIYSEYELGDVVLAFLERDIDNDKIPPLIDFKMQMVAERELNKLEENYKFIEMSKILPVLERRWI